MRVPVVLLEDDDDDHDHALDLRRVRRWKRSVVVAAIVAFGVVLGVAGDADAAASPAVALGSAQLTSQSTCPGGLRVSLALTDSSDGWTLIAHPAHTGCAIRTREPLRFHGAWDPMGARRCVRATRAGCLVGLEDAGFVDLGPVPDARGMTETSMVYCRRELCLAGTALVWRSA